MDSAEHQWPVRVSSKEKRCREGKAGQRVRFTSTQQFDSTAVLRVLPGGLPQIKVTFANQGLL